ncbi:EAL domain-containing protein [Ferriphaselus sp. R-1]|uniref:bifunctional diguanylate cyclase/phosphodiesterase n=1 Tax=Ferriphaselus sp. R-1 TaxID=1485544 RepID=UPI0005518B7C|nr:EAL domain-containing protein [Ferriphaselus sp. R-1]
MKAQDLLQSLHPRHSLRAQISLASGIMVLLLSTALSFIAADISRQHIEISLGEDFARRAAGTLDVMDRGMFERYREIQIAATLDDIRNPQVAVEQKRAILGKLQDTFNAYAWIGICDNQGVGLVGTGKYLEGKDLSKRPWCNKGRTQAYIGDVHDALLLSKLLPNPSGEMFYLLDVAAPVHDHDGRLLGVLCGHIFWRWAEEMLESNRTPNTDLVLVNRDGLVLAGPVKSRSPLGETAPQTMAALTTGAKSGHLVETWRDGHTYLVGYARGEGYRDYPGLGWGTVFRQDTVLAFAPARELQQRILLIGAGLGLLFAWLGWMLAGRIVRPIRAVEAAAAKVSHGDLSYVPPTLRGNGEVAHLSDAIRNMAVTLTQEIAERKRAEEGLRLAGKVFENNTEAIVITDADNNIVMVNPAFSEISGYLPEEVLGRNPRIFSSGKQDTEFYRDFWRQLYESGSWQGELWNSRKNGEVFPEWMIALVVRDEKTQAVTHHIAIYSDISERKKEEEYIQFLANYDQLTGLPNRTLLLDRAEQALGLALRNSSKVAVVFIDLDRFKTINDSLGHDVGDALLKQVAQRFKACLRRTDTLARQGGDEFVAILADLGSESEATHVAEKLLHALQTQLEASGHTLSITPSIGISLYPDDGQEVSVLMRNADLAMYRAKEMGRNNLQYFTAVMNQRAVERLELETGLRQAIANRELAVHYQPQVDLATGRLDGMEALLRWQHPQFGQVSPARFIPVAEEAGLIEEIGEWVLRQVCLQGRIWLAQGLPLKPLAVNLSMRQLAQSDLAERIGIILRDTAYPPEMLELEITESMLMELGDLTQHTLTRLKDMGIRLALDDFGTGYSSLSRLKTLPLDRLKIDQSFVRDINSDPDDAAIVRAVIAMGHNLNMRVLAEGVETVAQLESLRAMGCDEIQGYLLARPAPSEQASMHLRETPLPLAR